MKTLFYFGLAFLLLLTGCSSSSEGDAGRVAKQYGWYLTEEKYDLVMDMAAFDTTMMALAIEQRKEALKVVMRQIVENEKQMRGTVRVIEVVAERMDVWGGRAEVKLEYTYADGSIVEEDVNLVKWGEKWMLDYQ